MNRSRRYNASMRASVCATCVLLAGCFLEPQLGGVCGDGEVAIDEQCDDGNTTNGDSCTSACRRPPPPPPLCGNGVLDPGEQCDRGIASNPPPEPQCDSVCMIQEGPRLTMEWTFYDSYQSGASNCPPKQALVSLHAQELDENGANVGGEIVQSTDCIGGSDLLPLPKFGIYRVWVAGESDGKTYSALPVRLDLRTTLNKTVSMDVYLKAGYRRITWTMTDMQDAPLDCAQAGAAVVAIVPSGSGGSEVSAPCADGSHMSRAIPIGTHQISVHLLSPTFEFLSSVGPLDVTISEPNAVYDTNVTFKVAP
jgi:cysteine-rich repeat protein